MPSTVVLNLFSFFFFSFNSVLRLLQNFTLGKKNQSLVRTNIGQERRGGRYRNCIGQNNIYRGHPVKLCSERVCEGHLLCKLLHSQLSLMQVKTNFDTKINKVNGP